MKSLRWLALCGALAASGVSAQEPQVTPYRPSVANPADLPAPGRVEGEAGFEHARGGDESRRRASLPLLFKYAFNDRFGVLMGGEAQVWQTDYEGARRRGGGDATAALKFKHDLGNERALGLEAQVKAATAKTGIGSGKEDYMLTGIYSVETAGWGLDFNTAATRLGAVNAGEGRTELGWAASAERSLGGEWGSVLEVSGAARSGTRAETQGLAALTYALSRRTVLDFGAAAGLSRAAPDLTLFAGVATRF